MGGNQVKPEGNPPSSGYWQTFPSTSKVEARRDEPETITIRWTNTRNHCNYVDQNDTLLWLWDEDRVISGLRPWLFFKRDVKVQHLQLLQCWHEMIIHVSVLYIDVLAKWMFVNDLVLQTIKTGGNSLQCFFPHRVSLTLGCPMNLKKYPLDAQSCPIQIQSCKYLSILQKDLTFLKLDVAVPPYDITLAVF